ncbi:DUF2971 domain-containing protein [Rhodococcus opacus]|uniref:DUF2971 domain-containing protein n=1 Tax=Rhodococcus opacus TaxID=37919 RepID=UPI00155B31FE|nr:DUF2971 domain-containing protein [Rhodococcus opacus]
MSDKTPRLLYHYTSADALLSILQNQVLWATDTRYLNDTRELRHGSASMINALRRAANQFNPGPKKTVTDAQTAQAVTLRFTAKTLADGELFEKNQLGDAYIACFCEDGDQLGQWRGYGANGGGFAIGFQTDALETLAHELQPDGDTRYIAPVGKPQQVIYNPKEIKQRCKDVVASILAFGPNADPFGTGGFDAYRICLPHLAFMKHEAFAHEKEWRVLLINNAKRNLKFRSGPIGVIPYIEMEFGHRAVKEVVVGPGPHPQLRKQAVDQLLETAGYKDVRVRLSEVPYRP